MPDPVPWLAFPLTFFFIVCGIVALTYQLSHPAVRRPPRWVIAAIGAVYMTVLLLWILLWLTKSLSADLDLILLLMFTGGLFVQATLPFIRHAPKAADG